MKYLVFLSLFASQWSLADVRVAFFRAYDSTGELIRLEPGGQFFHLALQLEDRRWIHVHSHGVEILADLHKIGLPAVILTNLEAPAISLEDAQRFVGLPFDHTYSWSDLLSTYCAKLVAQLLRIEPLPMTFATNFWSNRGLSSRNGLGLSPDDIFADLKGRGFTISIVKPTCGELLHSPFLNLMAKAK